ncbi:hypothetical protein [Dokdonella sp.]|uniref:hypothetical protein n=1 Tax=Dokdonella sp. TaxID=2291710 RepID=UPI002DD6A14B|nr:hypothetical protein [Dokdonella sp.]
MTVELGWFLEIDMEIGALTLFERMHSNGTPGKTILVAAWHWKWSLTWRWHLSWYPGLAGKMGLYFMRVHRGQGFNFHAGVNFPLLGSLSIQTQPNMRT